ncbi:Hypothetical predicted protein [Mytilus galloprovincialis]|uniref:C2H2-type domain-containing protein n=1 Tax=Mytilus galloprovincialis TaxID=29158 RepID=A0A8B6FYM8_MYTGA|nr:Hypothetical predicted protein [Mytilus galloprovincialis]
MQGVQSKSRDGYTHTGSNSRADRLKDAYLKNHCLYEDKGGDHKCTQCEATFSRASHLKDHMDMHTGIKSNICKICGKAYRFRRSLSRHSKTHEVAEGLSYECDICNKTFTQKRHLQEHKKAHNTESVKCTFCSKVFKSKRYLQGDVEKHHEKTKSS